MKKKQIREVCMCHALLKLLRIMKVTFGLLLVFVVQGWAIKSYSQKTVLNLDMKNVNIVDVLEEIENQTDYYFLFNYEQISSDKKIDVKLANSKIEETMNYVLSGTGLKYTITDRQIVITKDESKDVSDSFLTSAQQQKNIIGKVTSSNGEPIPGVTVLVKGTTIGTITDFSGSYTISNVPTDGTLVFSFVGMKNQEVSVSGKTTINVTMTEETIGIDEIVAVGYGTQKK